MALSPFWQTARPVSKEEIWAMRTSSFATSLSDLVSKQRLSLVEKEPEPVDEGYFSASPTPSICLEEEPCSSSTTSDDEILLPAPLIPTKSVRRSKHSFPAPPLLPAKSVRRVPELPPLCANADPIALKTTRRSSIALNFRIESNWSRFAEWEAVSEPLADASRSIQLLCWTWTPTAKLENIYTCAKDIIFISIDESGSLKSLLRMNQQFQPRYLCRCSLSLTVHQHGLGEEWNTSATHSIRDFARALRYGTCAMSTIRVLARLMQKHESEMNRTREVSSKCARICRSCGGQAVYFTTTRRPIATPCEMDE